MLHIHILYIVHMYATLCNIYVHQIHGLREGARTTNTIPGHPLPPPVADNPAPTSSRPTVNR